MPVVAVVGKMVIVPVPLPALTVTVKVDVVAADALPTESVA